MKSLVTQIKNAIAEFLNYYNSLDTVFQPSPYQKEIWNAVQTGNSNIFVQAYAGTGKTSTLVELAKLLDPALKTLYLAFNKKIQVELEERLPGHCTALTFHSFGMKCFGHKIKIDKWKTKNLVSSHLVLPRKWKDRTKADHEMAGIYESLIGFAKNMGVAPNEYRKYHAEIVDHFAVEIPEGVDEESLIGGITKILNQCIDNSREVDFDDMIYIPALNAKTNGQYDIVFVDEAQDINGVQLMLLENMRRRYPDTKFVFVGDKYQAIYGFRGAGTNSVNEIIEQFDCKVFDLPISYRCGESIIGRAREIVPGIMPRKDIPGGIVGALDKADLSNVIGEIDSPAFVLSRTNADLIPVCFDLMRNNISVKILGIDIAKRLLKTVNEISRDKCLPISEFQKAATDYFDDKIEMYIERGKENMVKVLEDQTSIFYNLMAGLEFHGTVKTLIDKINEIYSDTAGNVKVTLMTIHKSKGLECPIVFQLDNFHKVRPNTDWQKQQEQNLRYVSITRAQYAYFMVK